MSRTFKDMTIERQEQRKWKNTIRWQQAEMNSRVWFECQYCKITYSGKKERLLNGRFVCPLCGDAHTDSERIY